MPLTHDMTQSQATEMVHGLLGMPEDRFPADFDATIPRIRELFHTATRNQWDPRTDIPWHELDLSRYTDAQLYAARQYWSRRAWSEYGAISESPTLQIRFGIERRPTDMQLFFTIRSQEETRHAEVCHMMAEKLGGYIDKPVVQAYQGSVATHGVRRAALDTDVPLEGIIAALVCTAEEIAFDVFHHLVEITRDPVAKAICKSIMRDEVRHCAFGWYFLEHAMAGMTREQIARVRESVIVMVEKVELNGYHSAWLAPPSPASDAEVEADRITWEAGLGATVEEAEKPVFVDSVKRVRARMSGFGIELPVFQHPKIGAL